MRGEKQNDVASLLTQTFYLEFRVVVRLHRASGRLDIVKIDEDHVPHRAQPLKPRVVLEERFERRCRQAGRDVGHEQRGGLSGAGGAEPIVDA